MTKKKPLRKRTVFTIISMIMIFGYTVAVLVLAGFDKMVPSELTVAWFAAWTTELGLLFGLKIRDKDTTNG